MLKYSEDFKINAVTARHNETSAHECCKFYSTLFPLSSSKLSQSKCQQRQRPPPSRQKKNIMNSVKVYILYA
jgi:hypothetical protein